MLFSEMQTDLGIILGDADHATWPLTEKVSMLNIAYRNLLHELYERTEYAMSSSTIAVTAGTQKYNFAAGFFALRRVYIDNSGDLDIVDRDPGFTGDRGQPARCWIEGAYKKIAAVESFAQIGFWPIPDAAYTVNIDWFPAADVLAADGDICAIPVDFHDVVIQDAAIIAWTRKGHEAQAKTLYDEGRERKTLLIDACSRRSRYCSPRFVNVMGGEAE